MAPNGPFDRLLGATLGNRTSNVRVLDFQCCSVVDHTLVVRRSHIRLLFHELATSTSPATGAAGPLILDHVVRLNGAIS